MFEVESRLKLLPTAQLLLAGGDARLRVDGAKGVNRYGCSPLPTPHVAAFGSSTATSISKAGFAAADRLRSRLLAAFDDEAHELIYARELNRIRKELLQLSGLADLRGLETVMAASGTDLHLIAAQIAAGSAVAPTRVIMMEATETGRGVAAALKGRHFSSRSALGRVAHEGTPVSDECGIELASVAIRMSDGRARPIAEVDEEVNSLVTAAVAKGQRVLLIAIDVSKTGLIAPSSSCVLALRQRHRETVEVLVDACQFRIAPATLRAYLEHDCMVALTGSKFVTGPAFSGALLIPAAAASRLRHRVMPRAMSAYSTRAEWPRNWEASAWLDDIENFGLLLRWEAALAELKAFRLVPENVVSQVARAFADAVIKRLNEDPAFEALPTTSINRRHLIDTDSWDRIPTIFPFLLLRRDHGQARRLLTREQTQAVYQTQQSGLFGNSSPSLAGMHCQLGQPVACGDRDGVAIAALRLCLSSRMISEAAATMDGVHDLIRQAMTALDRTAALADTIAH
ncbi:hypothetical protein BH11PSE11_BH11PSE11_14780 [soil metagenome]